MTHRSDFSRDDHKIQMQFMSVMDKANECHRQFQAHRIKFAQDDVKLYTGKLKPL